MFGLVETSGQKLATPIATSTALFPLSAFKKGQPFNTACLGAAFHDAPFHEKKLKHRLTKKRTAS